MCVIYKNNTGEPVFKAAIELQTYRRNMGTVREGAGGTNWEIRMDDINYHV